MHHYLLKHLSFCILSPDDFNRVILSMKRGQEFTDYINASFIDVSISLMIQGLCTVQPASCYHIINCPIRIKYSILTINSTLDSQYHLTFIQLLLFRTEGSVKDHYCICVICAGLQAEGLLHSNSGTFGSHSAGLLAYGVGVEVPLYCHADWAKGERAGQSPYMSFYIHMYLTKWITYVLQYGVY